MTVVSTHKDPERLTMTIIAEFDAKVKRVWRIWQDPRQLERWWGPPTYPATFELHEFATGGKAHYYMTAPDGEKMRGWWLFTGITEPHTITFDDGFADDDYNPKAEMGTTHAAVSLEAVDSGTRMSITSRFESLEQLEQMVEMGMEEGMKLAMGQIDDLLEEATV